MKQYRIRDEDGEIYTFKNADELLEALARALGHEFEYMGEWI
jgi:hypothetical protein